MFCRHTSQIQNMSISFLTNSHISQQFKNTWVLTWWFSSFGNFLFPCWFHCSHSTDCLYIRRQPKSYHQEKYLNQLYKQQMMACAKMSRDMTGNFTMKTYLYSLTIQQKVNLRLQPMRVHWLGQARNFLQKQHSFL
jgi:hypothetical protein